MRCIYPGFTININEMIKLFKECPNMSHRIKKEIKEGSSFMQWCVLKLANI